MTRFLSALFLSAALAAGCDTGPKIVPVSGVVLIDGKPATGGTIQVVPAGSRAASGAIGPDGRFALTTLKPNDGCYVGTHPVSVLVTREINAQSRTWLAPQKYADTATSGLTVEITGPTDDLKIELTWAGGKPFVERYDKE